MNNNINEIVLETIGTDRFEDSTASKILDNKKIIHLQYLDGIWYAIAIFDIVWEENEW